MLGQVPLFFNKNLLAIVPSPHPLLAPNNSLSMSPSRFSGTAPITRKRTWGIQQMLADPEQHHE